MYRTSSQLRYVQETKDHVYQDLYKLVIHPIQSALKLDQWRKLYLPKLSSTCARTPFVKSSCVDYSFANDAREDLKVLAVRKEPTWRLIFVKYRSFARLVKSRGEPIIPSPASAVVVSLAQKVFLPPAIPGVAGEYEEVYQRRLGLFLIFKAS